jgi:hypothetical protein
MEQGRYLSGLGQDGGRESNEETRSSDAEVTRYEADDDVYGSGIFSSANAVPTVNPNLGVFKDNPSLPGYVGRQRPFTVDSEVKDITDDAQVVEVPGGGMAYVERDGKNYGPIGQKPWGQGPLPGMPLLPPIQGQDPYLTTPRPLWDVPPMKMLPMSPMSPVSHRPAPVGSRPVRARPAAVTLPVSAKKPMYYGVRAAQVPVTASSNLRGFGEGPSAAGWGTYLALGAIAGAAAAIFYGTVNMPGRKAVSR